VTVALAAVSGVRTAGQEQAEPEVSIKGTPFTLKVERNEVPVRVVVRDMEGRAVRNLTKDDFCVLDDGKPQVISQFSVESRATTPRGGASPETSKTATKGVPAAAPSIADRFVALYFDDLVMDLENVVRTRDAASKYLKNSLQPGDRVAIATSSGRVALDFAADRDKLQEAIARLRPNGRYNQGGVECPDLSDYEAYLIDELHDPDATAVAGQKLVNCACGGDTLNCRPAESVEQVARMRWAIAQEEIRASLRGLEHLVRRLSVLPGQRSIVFISSGFFSDTEQQTISEIIDLAVRAGVVVNALDSRGLYVIIPGGDASEKSSIPRDPTLVSKMFQFRLVVAQQAGAGLAELAEGTGGVFFHNDNGFDAGFRLVGGLVQFSYVLTFSPGSLTNDGKYHHIKVELVGNAKRHHYNVQARKGYFAPRNAPNSPEVEKEELTAAVFSGDEINSARVHIGASFFKSSTTEAHLTVTAHLDTQWLSFRTENNLHLDHVTFVTAVFDSDGNYVEGIKKTLELRLSDASLEEVRAAGISVANNFKIPPGTYKVREVVRDNSGLVSSTNSTLEIPY
jgi:VWFA-related protein